MVLRRPTRSAAAHVVVRDGAGEVVCTGDLALGEKHGLKVAPPVRVQSSDGGASRCRSTARTAGRSAATAQPAQNTFPAAR